MSGHTFIPGWLRNFWSGEIDNVWDGHFGWHIGQGSRERPLDHSFKQNEESVDIQPAGPSSGPTTVAPSDSEADWIELKELLDSIHLCREGD
jgi:hypothetical protein